MTIRFTLSSCFVFHSLVATMFFVQGQSAIALSARSASPSTLTPRSILSQQTVLALKIPFFKNKKRNSQTTDSSEKEYIFRAPTSEAKEQRKSYQVQVYGSDTNLLEEIQAIEPKAFKKGNLIQVGVFSEQKNAEELLQRLAMEGFWARILVSN